MANEVTGIALGMIETRGLVPAIDAIKWGAQHFLWVGGIAGGIWVWAKGADVIMTRLQAYRSGANLGR